MGGWGMEFEIRDDLNRGVVYRPRTGEWLDLNLPPGIEGRDITIGLMQIAYERGYQQAQDDFKERTGLT